MCQLKLIMKYWLTSAASSQWSWELSRETEHFLPASTWRLFSGDNFFLKIRIISWRIWMDLYIQIWCQSYYLSDHEASMAMSRSESPNSQSLTFSKEDISVCLFRLKCFHCEKAKNHYQPEKGAACQIIRHLCLLVGKSFQQIQISLFCLIKMNHNKQEGFNLRREKGKVYL